MHELLLFSQIPSQNHTHFLKILAGVTAMQPLPLLEHHILFKPSRNPSALASAIAAARAAKPGGASGIIPAGSTADLFYLRLVGDLETEREEGRIEGGKDGVKDGEGQGVEKATETGRIDFGTHPWSLEFRDLPDVQGKRPVTSRMMTSVPITAGDPVKFVEAMGYNYTTAYVLQGHHFTTNNIHLRLTRTLLLPTNNASDTGPAPAPSDVSSLSPLDASGAYLLEASLRVQDGAQPELMGRGATELMGLKEALKGVVELEPVERLALDTRVK